MPKVNVERNTFVKGLITEASPLTFPENASIDEDNFVLNREGSRDRRLGMDYENLFVKLDTGVSLSSFGNTVTTSFRWENANDDPANTICVVQMGYTLWFFDGFSDDLSANVIGTLSISSIAAQSRSQFAAISGQLVVVNAGFSEPKLITYDGVSTFTEVPVSILVRDIWGVDDGLETSQRVSASGLTRTHEYNLFNQGWSTRVVNLPNGERRTPHVAYFDFAARYPSNADVWHLAKNAVDQYDPFRQDDIDIGSRQAAKGRVIIDAFTRGTSRRQFMTDAGGSTRSNNSTPIPLDEETSTFSTIAAFAGRIFYGGVDSVVSDPDANTPLMSSTIFFTQIITRNGDFGKCHSLNDTTTETFNDLLATDGGTITIPEASRILRLISLGASLVVIAENGVWEIAGPDGVFVADDFSIRQVSNIGATNDSSIVVAETTVYFWSKAGIYLLIPNEVTGKLSAQNVTESTIQTLYTDIESVGRTNSTGRYDADARRISWLYNDSAGYDGIIGRDNYNRELVFDTVLKAFYTFTYGSTAVDSPYVSGYMPVGGFDTSLSVQNVEVNGDQVQVNGEDVVITTRVRSRGQSSTKYIVIKPNATGNVEFTFGTYSNPDFLDWEADDAVGVDAPAHLIAGYELFGDTMRRKQVPYLFMHFKVTEDTFILVGDDLEATNRSSCLVQTQWDFSSSDANGKFGTQFQAYRLSRMFTPTSPGPFDSGKKVLTTKSKLRGIGRSFSMRVDSEPGRNLYLYGWGIVAEGGSDA